MSISDLTPGNDLQFDDTLVTDTNPVPVKNQNDYFLDIVKGNYPGLTHNVKYGRVLNIDANATSIIKPWSAAYFWQTTADTYDVFSSSANDTSAGTGARKITIFGLNSSYVEISEEVTMNGVSTVTTSSSFFRITRARVTAQGTGGTNIGNITIRTNTGANIVGYIVADKGSTEQVAFTIPAGKTAYIVSMRASIYSAGSPSARQGLFELVYREFNGPWIQGASEGFDSNGGPSSFYPKGAFKLPEKTDILIRMTSFYKDTGATAIVEYLLEDN